MNSYRKLIIASVVALAGLAAAAFMLDPQSGSSQGSQTGGGSIQIVGEGEYRFGSISMAAGIVRHEFKIKNTGTASAVVSKMYTSCMCTTARLKKGAFISPEFGMAGHGFMPSISETLAPGEEAVVEVAFDPAAHGPAGIGRIERAVTIEAGDGSALELAIAADVTP